MKLHALEKHRTEHVISEWKNVLRSFLRIPLLAGSGHNASCNQLQWLETVADCKKVREDVTRLHELFSALHC